MKMIDVLVRELPKIGGWPEGAEEAFRHKGDNHPSFYRRGGAVVPGVSYEWERSINLEGIPLETDGAGECEGQTITREQYQFALAASKQPEWNGEGLPPVGCECESFDGVSWLPVVIVGRYDGFAFAWNYDYRKTLTVNEEHSINFRPIRTEAERKRKEIAQKMCNLFGNGIEIDEKEGYGKAWLNVYDAIAAGKISGIRLTDDTGN